jgi:hypothetical protein
MLGYTKEDLDEMSHFVGLLMTVHLTNNYEKVWLAYSFLQGLWAEGYFD